MSEPGESKFSHELERKKALQTRIGTLLEFISRGPQRNETEIDYLVDALESLLDMNPTTDHLKTIEEEVINLEIKYGIKE